MLAGESQSQAAPEQTLDFSPSDLVLAPDTHMWYFPTVG